MLKGILQKFERKSVKVISGQRFLSIQLDITNTCNLNCSHCYHDNHSNKGGLNLNEWGMILDEYQDLLNLLSLKPSIVISGGEPLTCAFLFDLIINIRNRWPLSTIIILSNGTLLDDKIIEFFKNHEVSIQVSLEVSNSILHDRIRGKGTFDKTVNNIKLAIKEGLIVYTLTVLSTRTSKEIKPLFELAKDLKVTALNFTRLIPQGKAKDLIDSSGDRVLSGIQLRDAYRQILNCSREMEVMTNTDKPLYVLIDKSLGKNSLFGFQGLVVDYLGNLKVSSRSNLVLGNVRKKGLKNLFLNNPIMKKFRKGKIEICGQCEYYKKCGGDRNMSYFYHGDFFKVDPGCWLTKYKGDKMKRLRKCLISIFVLIPLASISFASEQEMTVDGSADLDMKEMEKDFVEKMVSDKLPNSYYQILGKYGIDSVNKFLLPENKQFKEDLVDKYIEEVLMKTGGGSQSWGY